MCASFLQGGWAGPWLQFHFSFFLVPNTSLILSIFTLSWIDLIIPPKFTKKLKKMDSIKGSFVHLECIVSGSHPISIQWYKDGEEITASEKHKYSFHDNTAFLEINQLQGIDSGSYTCEATNKAGSNQCSAHLTVKGWDAFSFSTGNIFWLFLCNVLLFTIPKLIFPLVFLTLCRTPMFY